MNITNPDEVLNGAKPNISQIGPYVYSEYSVKLNVSWEDDGDVINFWDKHYYVFRPDLCAVVWCLILRWLQLTRSF